MASSIFLVSHPAPNPTMSPLFLIIRSPLWSVRPSNGCFALQFTRPTFRGRPSSTIFGYLAHLASVSGRWGRSAEGDNEQIINEIRVSLLKLQPWTSNSLVCPANSWARQTICPKMTFQGGACFNEDWQPTMVEYAIMRVCEYADRTRHHLKSPTEMRNPAHRETTQHQRYATYSRTKHKK